MHVMHDLMPHVSKVCVTVCFLADGYSSYTIMKKNVKKKTIKKEEKASCMEVVFK